MRVLAKALVGAVCGVLPGMAVLYAFTCLAYALGLVSINAIGAAESLSPEMFAIAAFIGGCAGVPDRRWRAALVGAVVWTLLYLGVDLISGYRGPWSDPALLPKTVGLLLLNGPLSGAAFGLAVNATRRWALRRLEADWEATQRLYGKRPPRRRVGRSEEDRVHKLD